MKIISNFSSLYNYNKVNIVRQKSNEIKDNFNYQTSFTGLGILAAIIKSGQRKKNEFAVNFFLKNGKPDAESCREILAKSPNTIVKAYKILEEKSFLLDETPKTTVKAGYNLKKYFDKNYKDYRIISVGTSPANVAQAMEYLGAEVVYIPITGAKQYDNVYKLPFLKKQSISELRNAIIISEYFKTKIPKNDCKTNILLDFTISGKSINVLAEILSKNTGISREKFKCCSLIRTLYDCLKENIPEQKPECKLTAEEIDNIRADCLAQTVEYCTNVPHFYLNDREITNIPQFKRSNFISSAGKSNHKVFREFDDYSCELGRAYGLCMYNELKNMGLMR